MKESMIQEALALFEQRGDNAVEEINVIMKNWEFTNSVAEYRKVDKLSAMVERYGDSPENIVIRKEERMMLLHFVCWLKVYLKQVRPLMWYVWRDTVIYGMSIKQCAKKYKITESSAKNCKSACKQNIKRALPLYYAQFGNLEEYLKN